MSVPLRPNRVDGDIPISKSHVSIAWSSWNRPRFVGDPRAPSASLEASRPCFSAITVKSSLNSLRDLSRLNLMGTPSKQAAQCYFTTVEVRRGGGRGC